MAIELYHVEGSKVGGESHVAAELVFGREDANVPDDAIEFVGEYPTLEAAVEAADCEGAGLFFTSRDDDGHYTGMVRCFHGARPEFREI
jgi:hypothetical protein